MRIDNEEKEIKNPTGSGGVVASDENINQKNESDDHNNIENDSLDNEIIQITRKVFWLALQNHE